MLVAAPNLTLEAPKKIEEGDELLCLAGEFAERVNVVVKGTELILNFEGGRQIPLSRLKPEHGVYMHKSAQPRPYLDRNDKKMVYVQPVPEPKTEAPELAHLRELIYNNFIATMFSTDKISFYAAKYDDIDCEYLLDELMDLITGLGILYSEIPKNKFRIRYKRSTERLFGIFKGNAMFADETMRDSLRRMEANLREGEIVCNISTAPLKYSSGEYRIYVEFKIL